MAEAGLFPDVQRVEKLLRAEYKLSRLGHKAKPLDELVYILLSGRTAENKQQAVYDAFKQRFPRWNDVADASLADLAAAIASAGLARQKARYLRALTRKLRRDFGRVSLAALEAMTTEEAERYLCSLPGVNRRAARCVLMYALDRPVFPSDAHCLRIMSRLGWVDCRGISPREIVESVQRGDRIAAYIADIAQEGIPSPLRRPLHVFFVQHGRAICQLRPRCGECVLRELCPRIGVTEAEETPPASA
jgi:endonuclease III